MKRQSTNLEKTLTVHIFNKGFVRKIHEYFLQINNEKIVIGNSLVVQLLGLCASTVGAPSIPGQGTKIAHPL